MVDDELPPEEPGSMSREFNDARTNRARWASQHRGYLSQHHKDAASFEPSITSDIGNFFRVLFAFFGGLWKQDMAEFELLSSVYFPQPPESEKKEESQDEPAQEEDTAQPDTGAPETRTPGTEAPPVEKPSASTPPSAPGQKPETETEHRKEKTVAPPAASPETHPSEEKRQETGKFSAPPRKKTHYQEKNDLMQEITKDPDHPYRKLPQKELADLLTKGIRRPDNFNDMINIILPFEGNEVSRKEPRGGISKYGINSKAHPGLDIENLTKEQAKQIFRAEYWNKLKWPGGDKNLMSFAVRTIALDTAVNCGLKFANDSLLESYKKANYDVTKMPQIMLEMRRDHNARLIKNEPGEYARNKDGWENRIKTLEKFTSRHDMMVPTVSLTAHMPVDARKYRVSDTYHIRDNHPVHHNRSLHRGTDYAMPENTLLLSPAEGSVISAKEHNGYGQTLIISHGNGIFGMYAHLNYLMVKEGDSVRAGQQIARSGNTGTTKGAHLHHELWLEKNGVYYAIDEREAVNKNLLDPNVREALIKKAEKVGDIFSIHPKISGDIPAEFRNEGSRITKRTPSGEESPQMASSALASPSDLVLR